MAGGNYWYHMPGITGPRDECHRSSGRFVRFNLLPHRKRANPNPFRPLFKRRKQQVQLSPSEQRERKMRRELRRIGKRTSHEIRLAAWKAER